MIPESIKSHAYFTLTQIHHTDVRGIWESIARRVLASVKIKSERFRSRTAHCERQRNPGLYITRPSSVTVTS